MGEERRTSRRSEFKLPFQWRLLNAGNSLAAQIRHWSLEEIVRCQLRSATLQADFEQAARAIADSATSFVRSGLRQPLPDAIRQRLYRHARRRNAR